MYFVPTQAPAVQAHVVDSSLVVLTVRAYVLGIDSDIQGSRRVDAQGTVHRDLLAQDAVKVGRGEAAVSVICSYDVNPLVPSRQECVAYTIVGVTAFMEAMVNATPCSMVRVAEPEAIVSSLATKDSRPVLVVFLRIYPEGDRVLTKVQGGVV